jgi:hypothetical protein
VEYTGAVGTAPSLNSRPMNGQFDATPPSSARAFLWIGTATVTGELYARFAQTYEKVGSANSGFYLDEFALGPVLVPAKNLLVLRMEAGGRLGCKSWRKERRRKWLSLSRGAGAVIFTDDRAPIEEMARRMLLESKKP